MNKPEYVLLACGATNVPQLEINVAGSKDDNAKELAALMVKQLIKAGYHTFDLYDVSTTASRLVARLRVAVAEPEVLFV